MVLQRDMPLPVWGLAQPGAEVVVSLADSKAKTKADEAGKWMVKLPARQSGGGALQLSIKSGKEALTFKNVVMGEVWICSGQSNMQMGYNGVPEVKKMASEANSLSNRKSEFKSSRITLIPSATKSPFFCRYFF